MDLSDDRQRLLRRLLIGSLVFSGNETDEACLAMLQLFIAGLVESIDPRGSRHIEWQITSRGRHEIKRLGV